MKVIMPQLGETVTEGTVTAWYKKPGDAVRADEVLLDIETDKVATEITVPVSGVVADILVDAGATVAVGTVLAMIQEDGTGGADEGAPDVEAGATRGRENGKAGAGGASAMRERDPGAKTGGAQAGDHGRRLSPAVRKLLADYGISADAVNGTGKGGRITKGDVLGYLEAGEADSGTSASAGGGTFKKFSRIRKITAERMVQSKATSPHVLQAVEVDFTAISRVRDQVKAAWTEERGFSLTYLPFIAHGVCATLREYPDLNSSVQEHGLMVHRSVKLAIAVDLGPKGLVAPVIASACQLSVQELAHAIHRISTRARAGELSSDELAGGTYTVSNSGTFGTMITAPVINQPQVAILSVDGIRKRPVVVESETGGDAVAIRQVGVLAQSFDHRAVDGAYSAAFLNALRQRLETHDWRAGF